MPNTWSRIKDFLKFVNPDEIIVRKVTVDDNIYICLDDTLELLKKAEKEAQSLNAKVIIRRVIEGLTLGRVMGVWSYFYPHPFKP